MQVKRRDRIPIARYDKSQILVCEYTFLLVFPHKALRSDSSVECVGEWILEKAKQVWVGSLRSQALNGILKSLPIEGTAVFWRSVEGL